MVDLTGSASPFQQSIPNIVFYVPAVVVFGLAGKLQNIYECHTLLSFPFIKLSRIMFDDVESHEHIEEKQ